MLTLDQLQNHAPSVFATEPASHVSSKYGFISSRQVVESMLSAGYTIESATEKRSNKPENRGYNSHMVRFNLNDKNYNHDLSMQAVYMSSHNCTRAATIVLGARVFACWNGLVFGDFGLQVRHIGHNALDFQHEVSTLLNNLEYYYETIEDMKHKTMSYENQLQFVKLALGLRWKEIPKHNRGLPDYSYLYSNRKDTHANGNIWDTFNNVQENLTQGMRGRRTWVRPIKSLDTSFRLNKDLWSLAKSYL